MANAIQLVDIGRGLQLAGSRVTVQDLVPYLQQGCTTDEIMRWFPVLLREQVEGVERYYRDHQSELDDEDRKIRASVAEQVRLQRTRFPEESREGRLARMREELQKRKLERRRASTAPNQVSR